MLDAYKSFREIRAAGLRVTAHCENLRCARPIHFAEIDLDALIAAGDRPPGRCRFVCAACGQPGTVRLAPIRTGGFAASPASGAE